VRRGVRVLIQFGRISVLTWTYHPFDELQVIIVGNGHDILRYVVPRIFLFVLARYM
jgi:hypothetical protein